MAAKKYRVNWDEINDSFLNQEKTIEEQLLLYDLQI